jgi:hypothetical protein
MPTNIGHVPPPLRPIPSPTGGGLDSLVPGLLGANRKNVMGVKVDRALRQDSGTGKNENRDQCHGQLHSRS